MTYTMKTAGMGLDTARRVMAYPEQHSAEQKARALVVVSYWNKRRSKQKAKAFDTDSLDYHFADKDN